MQQAGCVVLVCSVEDVLRKGAAEEWQRLIIVIEPLGRQGHIAGTAVGLRTVTGEREMEGKGL